MVSCLLYVGQGLWKFGNFIAPLLHLHNTTLSAVQAVSESLGKLTRVPLSRPSTFGKKGHCFGQGPWTFGNFMIMVNRDSAEKGIQKGKNEEAEWWLIQYRIYVKFEGSLGPGSERCVVSHMLPEWPSFSHPELTLCSVITGPGSEQCTVCCMSAKVFESLGIS